MSPTVNGTIKFTAASKIHNLKLYDASVSKDLSARRARRYVIKLGSKFDATIFIIFDIIITDNTTISSSVQPSKLYRNHSPSARKLSHLTFSSLSPINPITLVF